MAQQFLDVQRTGEVMLVKITAPKLDDSNAHEVGRQLAALVEPAGGPELHLDMGEVRYIGSVGLAKLVALHRKLQAAGGRLRLLNVEGVVFEAFQVTRLNTLFEVRRKAAG